LKKVKLEKYSFNNMKCKRLICVPKQLTPPIDGPQPCPKSVKSCPAGMKRVLKSPFDVPSFPSRGGNKGPRRSFGRGKRRRRKVLANEDESALPLSGIHRKCGKVYVCVPDTPNVGPQPCPKSVKTCPAGMKKVLKPGFGAVHSFPTRGGNKGPRRSFGRVNKRRRKVLANEDESALPEWAMRRKCGPVYICVPDKQNPHCPKSVMTCPKDRNVC
jgi:hypothetical protein